MTGANHNSPLARKLDIAVATRLVHRRRSARVTGADAVMEGPDARR
jgi:hypothetical protein